MIEEHHIKKKRLVVKAGNIQDENDAAAIHVGCSLSIPGLCAILSFFFKFTNDD